MNCLNVLNLLGYGAVQIQNNWPSILKKTKSHGCRNILFNKQAARLIHFSLNRNIIWLLKAEFITELNKAATPNGSLKFCSPANGRSAPLGGAGLFNSVINSAFNNQIINSG